MKKSFTLSKIKNFCLIILFFTTSMCFAQTQCPNSDFETDTLSGWVGETFWRLYSPPPATACFERETISCTITLTSLNNCNQLVK